MYEETSRICQYHVTDMYKLCQEALLLENCCCLLDSFTPLFFRLFCFTRVCFYACLPACPPVCLPTWVCVPNSRLIVKGDGKLVDGRGGAGGGGVLGASLTITDPKTQSRALSLVGSVDWIQVNVGAIEDSAAADLNVAFFLHWWMTLATRHLTATATYPASSIFGFVCTRQPLTE